MKIKLQGLSVYLVMLAACATGRPDKTPDIDGRVLPPLKMASLAPRDIEVEVHNERSVNVASGNAQAIENLVLGQISQSLSQGGMRLYPASTNKMVVRLRDCQPLTEENECLWINADFSNAKQKRNWDNKCVDQIVNKVTGGKSRGDVSRVYQDCLVKLFDHINRTFSLEARPASP